MQLKQVFSAYDGQQNTHVGLYKYCPVCGKQLALKDRAGKQRPGCPNCGFVHYRNPVPGVVVVIEKEGSVLLGKRRGGIQQGKWCLPQGYIEFEEDFLSAATREVKEETGLNIEIRSIISVVSNFLSPQMHTLAIILLARVVSGEPRAGDDLDAVAWFPLSGPLPEMAFEADKHIIERYAKTRFEGAPGTKLLPSSMPSQVVIPLKQGFGREVPALVKRGDMVKAGQIIGRDDETISRVTPALEMPQVKFELMTHSTLTCLNLVKNAFSSCLIVWSFPIIVAIPHHKALISEILNDRHISHACDRCFSECSAE